MKNSQFMDFCRRWRRLALDMIIETLNGIDWLIRELIKAVDNHLGIVTLAVGAFVFIVYLSEKKDNKSNAAKLILQEIRYAEAKVRNYRVHHSYTFTEKILPTNNWNDNISLFVKDLKETELDLISKFYSNAAYLDDVLRAISDRHNKDVLEPPNPDKPVDASQIDTGNVPGPASDLIESISGVIESVFNTPASVKLTEIAEKKWFHLF